jgi:DNA-binding NarL/FixJ family response regulator
MTQTVSQTRKSVVVVDTQPISIEGMRALLESSPDLRYVGAVTTLPAGIELVRSLRPSVVLIDKAFGLQPLVDWLPSLRNTGTSPVVWGAGIGNSEALRLVQAGARGVVQKTSELDLLMSCLRTAAEGGTWMSDTILQPLQTDMRPRSSLTSREHQVVELVERGMRNKEIAHSLGIQTGTVKIHLKHIFEKTGCRGRYGLALSGLREKGHFDHAVM